MNKGVPRGLDINILQPTEKGVFEGVSFSPLLTVENNADCEITNGNLRVRDLLNEDRSAVDEEKTIDLYVGEKKTEIFSEAMYGGDISTEFNNLNVNFLAEAEYSCSLPLDISICARSFSSESNNGEGLCKGRETITSGLKSAPITVTKIVKELSWPGDDTVNIDLEIYLEKMPEGNIEGDFNINLNFGSAETGCEDLDNLKWESGSTNTKKVINCWVLLENVEDVVMDNLQIDLSYNYKQIESISFPVRNNKNL